MKLLNEIRTAIIMAIAIAFATVGEFNPAIVVLLFIFFLTFIPAFLDFILCPTCRGGGKRKCTHCNKGYLEPKTYFSYSVNINKNNGDYTFRIDNLKIRNDRHATLAKIKLEIRHRLSAIQPMLLGEWRSKGKHEIAGFGETPIEECPISIELNSDVIKDLERILKRPINKDDDMYIDGSLIDMERKEICKACNGKGYHKCKRFSIGVKYRV